VQRDGQTITGTAETAQASSVLLSLPVLASMLAALTHRDADPTAAIHLLRGTLAGMTGFVAVCQIVLLITRAPSAPVFWTATVVALLAQAPALRARSA
jgi:hypothetical protein